MRTNQPQAIKHKTLHFLNDCTRQKGFKRIIDKAVQFSSNDDSSLNRLLKENALAGIDEDHWQEKYS